MPNKVFANLLSDSNCFEADCVAEKDDLMIQLGSFHAYHICIQIIVKQSVVYVLHGIINANDIAIYKPISMTCLRLFNKHT